MIKIILENINCHTHSEFLIDINKLTLIKGDSGIGKSSIFQGLTWCLYGTVRGICNFNSTKYSVTLIFSEFTIYRRGKPKLLQIIYPNSTIYEDKVAQGIINQCFGSEEIWNLTCYLEQDTRSVLLSGSNNDRMDLLNKLSFWSDNPDYYLERIDNEIKIQQDLFKIEQANYNAECSLLYEQLNKKPITVDFYLSPENRIITENNLNVIIKQLEQLSIELGNQNRLIGSLDVLKNKLISLSKSLESYKTLHEYQNEINQINSHIEIKTNKLQELLNIINSPSVDLISNKSYIESKISELSSLINQRQLLLYNISSTNDQLDKLKKTKNYLESEVLLKKTQVPTNFEDQLNISWTRMHLYHIIEEEKQRTLGLGVCNELKIEYNTVAINETLVNYKNLIDKINIYKSDLEIIKNVDRLRNCIESLGDTPSPDENAIINLDRKLNVMLLSQGTLVCPHCNRSIRYINGSLHPESGERVTINQINEVKSQLTLMKSNKERYTTKENYNTQIEQLSNMLKIVKLDTRETILDIEREINNLNNYHTIVHKLHQIKVVSEFPINSNILNKIIDYQESLVTLNKLDISNIVLYENNIKSYHEQLNLIPNDIEESINKYKKELLDIQNSITSIKVKYESQVSTLKQDLSILSSNKTSIQGNINQMKYLQDEYNNLSSQISELSSKLNPGVSTEINNYNIYMKDLRLKLERSDYYNEMYARQTKIEQKHADLLFKNKSLADLYSLKQIAFDLECNHLQTTVDSINESMNEILQDIFDKPIKVILKLYKKNKTNDKVKANVNLNIQYDGNDYDNMNKLSGGEKDRVSFALTLALSRINGSPILLLDETLRSLNESYRTLCIDVMKKFLISHKTVLCINHEDIEGNYDNVITLK